MPLALTTPLPRHLAKLTPLLGNAQQDQRLGRSSYWTRGRQYGNEACEVEKWHVNHRDVNMCIFEIELLEM